MIEVPEYKDIIERKKNSNICIVIPTFNQYQITKKTILKLKEQTIKFDIVVVDNASSDKTFELLKNDFEDITILLAKKNYGGAGGLFLGQKYAYEKGYEYIILSDNDAIPIDNDLIEEIVKNSDENHIANIINSAECDKPIEMFFHFTCLHYKIIRKVGFVDYKYFLYGDENEYELRLTKYKIKRNKIYKKYWHPIKYYQSEHFIYLKIRNELENGKKYIYRKKHTLETIFVKSLFFQLYEPVKFNLLMKAINDWENGVWDNSIINRKFKTNINFINKNLEDFFNLLDINNSVFVKIKRLNNYILEKKIKVEWYSRKFLFPIKKTTLITNDYIKAMFFYKEIFYIVSLDKENITFFKLHSISLFKKIIALKNSLKIYFKVKRLLNASR